MREMQHFTTSVRQMDPANRSRTIRHAHDNPPAATSIHRATIPILTTTGNGTDE